MNYFSVFLALVLTGSAFAGHGIYPDFSEDELALVERSDDELPKIKPRPVAECGLIYHEKAEDPCPADEYHTDRSKHCGVERYNKRKDIKCPGFEEKTVHDRGCYQPLSLGGCPEGFQQVDRWETSHKNQACGRYIDVHYTCHKYGECRLPEFKVEQWKKCAHKEHGVKTYKACRHPRFGVKGNETCEIMMTNQEIRDFLLVTKGAISPWSQLLVTGKVNYVAASLHKKNMTCMIARYDGSKKYHSLVSQLKSMFKARFNKTYQTPAAAYCEGVNTSPEIPSPAELGCQQDSEDDVCLNVLGYHNAKKWFLDRIKYIPELIKDLTKRSEHDKRFESKDELVALGGALEVALKEAD